MCIRDSLPDAVEHTRPDCGAYVDFSQGLDIRLITSDNVALLNKVRTKTVHFAWDNPNADLIGFFQRFSELSKIRDFRRKRVYVLTNWNSTHEQDLYRVDTLRRMGFDPYVMVYERPTAPLITRHLQRWVNNKQIFRTVESFADYDCPPHKMLKAVKLQYPKDGRPVPAARRPTGRLEVSL